MAKTRTLSPTNFEPRWAALEARWDLPKNGFWWLPLQDTAATGVVAFESEPFRAALGGSWLRHALAHLGVRDVVRVPEFLDLAIEVMSIAEATFEFTGFESYWIDRRPSVLEWIVYLSHEQSVTLGGADLIAAAQGAWPDWSNHLWNGDSRNYRPAVD